MHEAMPGGEPAPPSDDASRSEIADRARLKASPVIQPTCLSVEYTTNTGDRRIDDTDLQWLAAFETLAAFIGAVFGAVGCFAGALASDGRLTFAAGVGAAVCAVLWAARLEPVTIEE